MNYDDTKFLPYYELYYTGVIVAEYYSIQREIIEIETVMANAYADLVYRGVSNTAKGNRRMLV